MATVEIYQYYAAIELRRERWIDQFMAADLFGRNNI